ncbi:hypothetical protein J7E55_12210 [Bacillus sp. ISL-53]|nr:hypothetical protein [Bacillus sp. ISL-53]
MNQEKKILELENRIELLEKKATAATAAFFKPENNKGVLIKTSDTKGKRKRGTIEHY